MDNKTEESVAQLPRLSHYRAVIISPHLDDAVFSCGGAIAQMVKEGPVLVLNIFTRYLSEVKIRGVVLGEERYQEEIDAAAFLGYESINLGELDVSFRREAYRQLGNIFRPPVDEDMSWLPTLREKIFGILAPLTYDQVYVPLGIGWHVDHVLTYLLFASMSDSKKLVYYEDAPYCCIPHSTRYRLNEIADYPRDLNDLSLTSINETRAWWQTAKSYASTALIRNLQPWVVRKMAVPVVGFYLYRLMASHRMLAVAAPTHRVESRVVSIAGQFDRKVDAMALYRTQFKEFFSTREDCGTMLNEYAECFTRSVYPAERYWVGTVPS